MKRYWLLAAVALTCFAQAGLQKLRQTPDGTTVYKIEDKDGICYMAENIVHSSPNRPAVSISCFPREKR